MAHYFHNQPEKEFFYSALSFKLRKTGIWYLHFLHGRQINIHFQAFHGAPPSLAGSGYLFAAYSIDHSVWE